MESVNASHDIDMDVHHVVIGYRAGWETYTRSYAPRDVPNDEVENNEEDDDEDQWEDIDSDEETLVDPGEVTLSDVHRTVTIIRRETSGYDSSTSSTGAVVDFSGGEEEREFWKRAAIRRPFKTYDTRDVSGQSGIDADDNNYIDNNDDDDDYYDDYDYANIKYRQKKTGHTHHRSAKMCNNYRLTKADKDAQIRTLYNAYHAARRDKANLEQELESERDKTLCLICYQEQRSIVMFPCRHFAVGATCSARLNACPVCREPCAYKHSVFM